MMHMHEQKLLRRLVIPLLKKINIGDISIKHHYTDEKFLLHSFKHKGYWYHGKNREKDIMTVFQKLIQPSNIVIDIGGHIGYLSMFFANLVGQQGKVYVFEPGINNLSYIESNLSNLSNTELVKKAVSDQNGKVHFYIENLTGQNNSLLAKFDTFKRNTQNAGVNEKMQEIAVDALRLDDFIDEKKINPDWIKIDVEGGEYQVLKGMLNCLKKHRPAILVEVSLNNDEIFNIFQEHGYHLYSTSLNLITDSGNLESNTFCFHRTRHSNIIEKYCNGNG